MLNKNTGQYLRESGKGSLTKLIVQVVGVLNSPWWVISGADAGISCLLLADGSTQKEPTLDS